MPAELVNNVTEKSCASRRLATAATHWRWNVGEWSRTRWRKQRFKRASTLAACQSQDVKPQPIMLAASARLRSSHTPCAHSHLEALDTRARASDRVGSADEAADGAYCQNRRQTVLDCKIQAGRSYAQSNICTKLKSSCAFGACQSIYIFRRFCTLQFKK